MVDIDFATYARAILSDSNVLMSLILSCCNNFNEITTNAITTTGLLSSAQLNEALQDPQNRYILEDIRQHARFTRYRLRILALEEEVSQPILLIETAIAKLKDYFRDTSTEEDKNNLREQLVTLQEELKKMAKIRATLNNINTQLTCFADQFATLAEVQQTEWQEFRKLFSQKSVGSLEQAGCQFTEEEKVQLVRPESMREILERFRTINLPLPKRFDPDNRKYSSYFYLKAYLAVHESLARQMQPHNNSDVEARL